MREIALPQLSLVVLVGATSSGKSSFARKHFLPTEVISSDFCRGLVSNDENSLEATPDAFEVLHFIASKRLERGLLTVIDATNVQSDARKPLIELARSHDVLPVAIVLNTPERVCLERNLARAERGYGEHVIRQHCISLRRSLRFLPREGFRNVFILDSLSDIDNVTITREPLWNDKRDQHGPFDIIGDIHGCFDELVELLGKLGYIVRADLEVEPPPDRRAIFLGDLCDRGSNTPAVFKLVMKMVSRGTAFCVPGNHDIKLMRKLRGRDVKLTHGLAESILQLEAETPEFRNDVASFIDSLVSHYVLDDGKLVVAHAGMKAEYQGRGSGRVREFALYGETTGESDEFGLPVRLNWAAEYRGAARVVYGHTPVPFPEWLNKTINIDTGCVFGGSLTALQYPELKTASVKSKRIYCEPARPFLPEEGSIERSSQHIHDDVIDIEDVLGKRIIETKLMSNVTVREENALAALEIMSRFAIDPKWLIYLPPTMSPTETSKLPQFLEHPIEAFDHFRERGIEKVVCEEKHMGSRAVVVISRDSDSARKRFGVVDGSSGAIYTRTGRRFFDNVEHESSMLDQLRFAFDACGFWDQFSSDWFCLDCELMPWSAKAQALLSGQYAPIGSAGRALFDKSIESLQATSMRSIEGADNLLTCIEDRRVRISKYVDAYRHYCWKIKSLSDLKLAPFHLLASEGKVHVDKDHLWHMSTLARLAEYNRPAMPELIATRHIAINLTDPTSVQSGIDWWINLTSTGGEGMVIKPIDFVTRSDRGLVQPAIKVRGAEYLRIIYGPEYDSPSNLPRLRARNVGAKRSLALREFSLGLESLERFVMREPLRRVHECVFGVLALQSEPVDVRL